VSHINFELQPFIGAFPLEFGMAVDDVKTALGIDCIESADFLGGMCLNYNRPGFAITIGFDKDSKLATHFGLGRPSIVHFRGLDVFGDTTAWQSIVRMSSDCHEYVGFIICCDLGLQLSGFHDGDDSQLGISMFLQGRYDHHRPRFNPFSLS
jgi:hypothetical protein